MHICVYDNHDCDEIITLITTIQVQEFGVAISAKEQPDLLDILGCYQREGGNFWLALVDGILVGTIALKNCGGGVGALKKMFVKKEYRGKENGIAATLLRTLMQWAQQAGIAVIYLGTVDVYHAAHRFYEKNGFVEVARHEVPDSVPLMDVDRKYYRYVV